jgi:hypothetical protein
MKRLFLILATFLAMAGFLYAGNTINMETNTGGLPYGWHVGFFFNGQWIPGSEISGIQLFDLVDALYKNRMHRPIIEVARDYPTPCGPGPWTIIYGKNITIINPDGTETLIPPGSIITAINEAGLCAGMGKIEAGSEGGNILKFTCVYANDDWETKKTGNITGFRDGDKYHLFVGTPGRPGHKTVEEFVFKSGYVPIEVSKLTLWINK